MPKEKFYDDLGSIEVRWAKESELVCVVTTEELEVNTVDFDGNVSAPETRIVYATWQLTDGESIRKFIQSLQKAKRGAFPIRLPDEK